MSDRSETREALRQVLPVLLAVAPFGAVYGAVAVDGGLTLAQAMGFSAFVYAGASQLVALQLIGAAAPLWTILLSVLALNFRHVLYSASTGRHLTRFSGFQKAAAFFILVDPVFGASEARAAMGRLTRRYYFAYAGALYVCWLASTLAGTVFGGLIDDPRAYGLDFVLPVYFLALLMAFRSRGGFYAAAGASAVVALLVYATLGSPWHVTTGALAGVLTAAWAKPGTL